MSDTPASTPTPEQPDFAKAVPAALAVAGAIKDSFAAPIKPGWKTSEFWVVFGAGIAALANSAFGLHLPPDSLGALTGLAAAYALSRGIAKKQP